MQLFNALTHRIEQFAPMRPGEVRMYVCGLTVSDDAHLGHGRAAAVFDLLRRLFRYKGLQVIYVKNITDVDDKILARARTLGREPAELATSFLARHEADLERLRVPRAEVEPRASEHVGEMIAFVEDLLGKGAAYAFNGEVRFRLGATPDFGRLAVLRGRPVEAQDFVLWRPAVADEPGWPSPWERGRPGWHIECSTMSTALLGDTFDIHGGGEDLLHPHHDAEIAQCVARTGRVPARFFLYNGLVYLAEEKMSKSVGNFFTLREIFARYDPSVVRHYLFRTHYRAPIAFSPAGLESSRRAVERLEAFLRASAEVMGAPAGPPSPSSREVAEVARETHSEVLRALDEDLDTPAALVAIEQLVAAGEAHLASGAPDPVLLGRVEEVLDSIDELLDIRPEQGRAGSRSGAVIEAMLRVRSRFLTLAPIANLLWLELLPDPTLHKDAYAAGRLEYLEVVVGPEAHHVHERIGGLRFLEEPGAVVLAVRRRGRIRKRRVEDILLAFGDTLMIQAPSGFGDSLRRVRGFLSGGELDIPIERRNRMPIAVAALTAVLITGGTGVLPMSVASLAGGVVVVLAGCITPREMYRALPLNVLLLIAALIPFSVAFERSGLASHLAGVVAATGGRLGPRGALLVVLATSSLLAQIVQPNGVVAVMLPLAVAVGRTLEASPVPFALGVLFAAAYAFATPFSYNTNVMVRPHGGYVFADYLRLGLPLLWLFLLLGTIGLPILHPF
jgi:cysteinyl-tRNA synthetase